MTFADRRGTWPPSSGRRLAGHRADSPGTWPPPESSSHRGSPTGQLPGEVRSNRFLVSEDGQIGLSADPSPGCGCSTLRNCVAAWVSLFYVGVVSDSAANLSPVDPGELPGEILDDVTSVVGAEVTLLGRLSGGLDVGALRVQLGSTDSAVLKVWPRVRHNQLDEALRTQRVVEHMRRRGYPTPACLGVGATATHIWHLMEFVDAAPAPEPTLSLVKQLMEIAELQAGQATETHDHWSYAWRLATGHEHGQDLDPSLTAAVSKLPRYSADVSTLVERLRLMCAGTPPPAEAPDMVHADFMPPNILVRDGDVVAVVDIGNAGSGTRATDLITLQWHTFQDRLDDARNLLWTRILDLIGWEQTAVLTATKILTQLEFPIRHGQRDLVPGVIQRGHHALDELTALR